MNYRMILRIISGIMVIEILAMVPSLIIACYTNDSAAQVGFVGAIGIAALIALVNIAFFSLKKSQRTFYAREGMVTTAAAWIVLSLIGALPFYISGRIPNFINAFFEIISGFTTTGASVVSDVEALGKALLFWRSFSHWLGGMGVLVFFLALVPSFGISEGSALHLLRAESPGPSVGKIVPRMKDTASVLYRIYIALTILDIIFLLIGKMKLFDAFCIAFGTAGTGGFSVLNSGCATYTPFAQNVTTIFMLMFGVNFSIYYYMLMRRGKQIVINEELRAYFFVVAVSIALVLMNVYGKTPDTSHFLPALRHSAFQVASIITTTGYSTTNFDLWPSFAKTILICLMFVGACAGSTGGGIKVSRILILIKAIRRNTHEVFHPQEIRTIRMDGNRVSERTLAHVQVYLAAYVFIVLVSLLLVSLDPANYSMTTNFSAVMATFNNIGPGFDAVGPVKNFAGYNDFSTLVLCLDMLLGRLEIFPILVLFAPSTYRRT